jgi:hypothetical protein
MLSCVSLRADSLARTASSVYAIGKLWPRLRPYRVDGRGLRRILIGSLRSAPRPLLALIA